MFYIRADANHIIATGHIMRCMSIAKEIIKLGEEVTFITADNQAKILLEDNSFPYISLDSEWNNLDTELTKLIKIIEQKSIKKLLIDSYYVTENYLKKLQNHTMIYYLDDLALFQYPVDVLINYNIYADSINYQSYSEKLDTKFVLGCSYAPLRDEFKEVKHMTRNQVKSIVLTTGGADSYHVAYKFLNYIIDNSIAKSSMTIQHLANVCKNILDNIEIHIVVGKFSEDRERLQELSNKYTTIKLHSNVRNMSELMKSADIAITAGGSTMYELCACAVPMITYSFADNQLLGVRGMDLKKVGHYCGDIRDGEENLWYAIIKALDTLMSDKEQRLAIGKRAKQLVDGLGAQRIAKILLDK